MLITKGYLYQRLQKQFLTQRLTQLFKTLPCPLLQIQRRKSSWRTESQHKQKLMLTRLIQMELVFNKSQSQYQHASGNGKDCQQTRKMCFIPTSYPTFVLYRKSVSCFSSTGAQYNVWLLLKILK